VKDYRLRLQKTSLDNVAVIKYDLTLPSLTKREMEYISLLYEELDVFKELSKCPTRRSLKRLKDEEIIEKLEALKRYVKERDEWIIQKIRSYRPRWTVCLHSTEHERKALMKPAPGPGFRWVFDPEAASKIELDVICDERNHEIKNILDDYEEHFKRSFPKHKYGWRDRENLDPSYLVIELWNYPRYRKVVEEAEDIIRDFLSYLAKQ
jgi:hypothetical protein